MQFIKSTLNSLLQLLKQNSTGDRNNTQHHLINIHTTMANNDKSQFESDGTDV